jgi:hypothetical protein
MKHNSPIALLFVLVFACGGRTSESEEPDNGGRTHFLKSCTSDAECGSLECLSKLCTRSCDTDAHCTDLDDDARCEPEGNDSALCVGAPLAAPVAAPTAAPVAAPTAAPVAAPTAAPVAAPLDPPADAPDAGPSTTLSCEALTAPPVAVNIVDIEVTNERAEQLVLGSPFGDCVGSAYVYMESLDPGSPGIGIAGNCNLTCDQAVTQQFGCDPACPAAKPLVVDPGETVIVQWAARLANLVPVNPECCGVPDQCPSECALVSPAEPGPYRATFAAATVDAEEAAACREASSLWSPLPSSSPPDTVACQIEEAEIEDFTVDFEFGAGRIALTIR